MNKIQQKILPAIIVSENIPLNTNWLDKLPEDIKTSAIGTKFFIPGGDNCHYCQSLYSSSNQSGQFALIIDSGKIILQSAKIRYLIS
jgi:hypothetical protein